MKNKLLGLCWWILVLGIALKPGDSSGLIIYRWGGESLDPPPEFEADPDKVDFRQLSWLDLGDVGETFQLDMDVAGIRAMEHDPDFNIAPFVEANGGASVRPQVNGMVWDGDTSSVWLADRYLCREFRAANYFIKCDFDFGTPGTANIDLGLFYTLDRIRIVSGLRDPAGVVRGLRVHLSPEVPRASTHHPPPYDPFIVEVRDNRESFLDVWLPPHGQVRFLQVALQEHNDDWNVSDIEVYAKGFFDRSIYTSEAINFEEFGGDAAWGELRWSGFRELGAKVFIQTRSGADDTPMRYWKYTGRGDEVEEVAASAYGRLKLGEKAEITYDRDNWTFWSAPYDFADSLGTPVVSLSPRQFLQFKVDFFPQNESGGGIDVLELRASVPPVAAGLLGEISPVRVEVGKESTFSYFLKPTIQAGNTGFDRLEMTSSSIFTAVEGVKIADEEVDWKEEELKDDRFVISFPRVDQNQSGALIEVRFKAQPLRYGSSFNARVFDSNRPLEVPQGASAGDATPDVEENSVAVVTSVEEQSLLEAQVVPAVFTPNGDRLNDVVKISYDLFEITGFGAVTVEIRDLAGRRVRELYSGLDAIGHYPRTWDGTDDIGKVVPPGVYLYRVSVDTDKDKVDKIGTVHVAY